MDNTLTTCSGVEKREQSLTWKMIALMENDCCHGLVTSLRIDWRGARAPVLASSAGDLLDFHYLTFEFFISYNTQLHGNGRGKCAYGGFLAAMYDQVDGRNKKHRKRDGWLLQGILR